MSKQFNNFKKRAGKAALTLALVGATTIGASAASKESITTANLNMRTQSNTNSKIVLTIPKGQKVNILEEGKSWNKVEYKGKQGYSYKRYLKEVSSSVANVELKVKTGNSNLNVRAGASTNFKIIGKLKNGSVVKASEKTGGFYKINYNGQVGYISADYATVMSNGSNGGNNGGGSSTETPASGTMKNTASSLRIRKGAGTNTATIGYLDRNEEVTVLAKSGDWFKIKDKNGVVGYCSAKYLVKVENGNNGGTETVKPMTGKVKVVEATNLNVRSGAGTGHKVLGTVKGGTVLEITGQASNGWYQVKFNGKTGFISNKYAEVVKDEVKPQDQAPVITVTKETVTIEQRDGLSRGGYISATPGMFGAKATDKEDGDLTDKIEIVGNDNLGEVGSRDLTLQVKDSAGNVGKKVVKLVVTEKEEVVPPTPEPPVDPEEPKPEPPVTPEEMNAVPTIDANDLTLEFGQAFDIKALAISALDKEDGDLTGKVEVKGNVDVNKAGKYTLTLSVTDSKGAKATKQVVVTVKEEVKPEINEAPVITSVDSLTLEFGQAFNNGMLNASAIDKEDGKLEVKLEGTVNVNKAGKYTLTLSATDSKGLVTTKKVVVTVKEEVKPEENQAPTMTVANPVVTITEGGNFNVSAFGAVATDKEDGQLGVKLVGNYDVNKVGTYALQLVARDSKGLEVKKDVQLVVEARKNTAPTVTANSIEINQGDNFSYDMLGAKATDAEGDKVTITYEGTVDANKPGKYTIKVVATDDRGASSFVNVTVTVKEVAQENTNPNDAAFKSIAQGVMYSAVSSHRTANGMDAGTSNGDLATLAGKWSKLMSDRGALEHEFDGKGANEWFGHTDTSAENIAVFQYKMTGDARQDATNIANQAFGLWKNSAGHNANLLGKYSNVVGFNYHAVDMGNGVYQIWATQEFSYQRAKGEVEAEAPVVEEEVIETPEVEAPVVEEVVVPEVEEKEEVVVVPEEPTVEMEDTVEEVTEPTVEME